MTNRRELKKKITDLLHILTEGKDCERPILPLLELTVLILAMIALMFYDPFRITEKTMTFLRLHFPLFIKEPRLLYYASVYFGTFIFKILMLAFIAILIAVDRIEADDELALKKPSSSEWRKYIIPFIALSAFLRTSFYSNPLITNMPLRLVTPGAMTVGNVIIIFSVIFIAPVTEELIFRGYMYDVLKRGFGAYISIAITSLLFSLAHLPQLSCDASGFFIILALGAIFGIIRMRTGSILPPIVFHAIYNSVYIALGILNFIILGY